MPDRAEIRDRLVGWIAELLGIGAGEVVTDRPFHEFGLSSRQAVSLAGQVQDLVGRRLPPTLLWEHPTIDRLVDALSAGAGDEEPDVLPRPRDPEPDAPIAVVGVGCRFPGARGPEGYWDLLSSGAHGIGEVPEGRWERFAGADPALAKLPRAGGFLDGVDEFDAEFFEVSPTEAAVMDPQQRLLLEVAWEALEHAGVVPSALRGSATGVFVGVSSTEYGALTTRELRAVDAWTGTGAAMSIVANRLSYFLDLRGPSMAVDTACSSSLVAVHQACASLRSGESRVALAGGVNLLLSPAITANFHRAGALAGDGRCKAFDGAADGIVRGEGCGVVVLKRLADANRDGDRILAVVRGSAVNSDGRSNGLMAPNPAAQAELLRRAYAHADLDPSVVDYVEAHGTGTLLGDPIEAEGLRAVFAGGRGQERPLLLGSAKTNLGHLEAAAGIAGLIKVVLSMHHGRLPASLHYANPNPHIPFEQAKLEVVAEPRNWPKYSGAARAGVSGFGFGGTNAHVVLEGWRRMPSRRREPDGPGVHSLLVSGATDDRLRRAAADLADWLDTPVGRAASLNDVGHTLTWRRARHAERGVVVGRGRDELVAGLRGLAAGTGGVRGRGAPRAKGVVWVFSGYGSQWTGMARELLADEPVFAAEVDRLDPDYRARCGFSLRAALLDDDGAGDVRRTQLVLFGLQVAYAAMWRAHGVEPAAVIGHSLGEVAAAAVSGALDVSDGLRVMIARSGLLSEVDSSGAGAMAAVEATEAEAAELSRLFSGVTVAVRAAPRRCTIAGPADEVARAVSHVERDGRMARALGVAGAGHTSAVDGVLARLREELSGLAPREPATAVFSTVDPAAAPAFDAGYWVRNLRSPVLFEQAVRAAAEAGFDAVVELAPHPVAASAIEETLTAAGVVDPVVVFTGRRGTDDTVTFRSALAELHAAGRVPPTAYRRGRLVDLPLPSWQHESHWVARDSTPALPGHPLLGARVDLPDGGCAWRGDVGVERLPWLADHRVHDTPVLPATGYLEMVLAAAAEVLDVEPVQLSVESLELHRVLPLAASVPVTTTFRPDDAWSARVEVHTRSLAGSWTCHAAAVLSRAGQDRPAVESDVDGDPVELYGFLRAAGQHYGPAFRGVRAARAAGGVAVAEVALPAEADDAERFTAHPALVDACLQALIAAGIGPGGGVEPDGTGIGVPVELRGVRVLRAVPDEVRCHARLLAGGAEPVGSVLVTDVAGDPVLEIAEVRARALQAPPRPLEEAFLELRWESAQLPPSAGARAGSWLVLGDGDQVAGALRDAGQRVVHGNARRPGTGLDLLAGDAEHPPRGVVLAVDGESGPVGRRRQHVLVVAGVVRELVARDAGVRLWLSTSDPAGSGWGLRSLIRVLALEHPELRASLVDSDGAVPASLAAELLADSPEDEVRWRGTERTVARLHRAEPVRPRPGRVVRPGAYVITGGLGGLGRAVAGRLVERGARRVVLGGRSAPSAAAAAEIARWEDAGVEVRVVGGDVAAKGVAERLVAAATEGGMPLHGAVHAAGVLRDGPIAQLDEDAMAEVWRPKARGAWRLHEATAHLELDWWVVFSSAAALLGSPGQAAYAAANGWVDELVRARREQGLAAETIQWGPWSEVGGATTSPLAAVLDPLRPAEGLEAWEAVLKSGRAQTAVVRFDAARAVEHFPALRSRPVFGPLLTTAARGAESRFDVAALPDDPAAAVRAVTEHLMGEIAGILGGAAEELDPRTPLTMLGLDSLMATRARNAVERDFGVQLPAALLLRGANLDELARHLAAELDLGAAPETAGPTTIGPRDATERWLAHLWAQVLGAVEFGVTDEFAALGGTPEQAERVAERIGERLGSRDEVAELFAAPTVAAMADRLRHRFEGADGSVRALRESGARRPLFLFHPAGGPTSVYQPLVAGLGADQPCFGLERLDDLGTVELKAERYVELIRERQPEGPYRLGGWSFGGCLAYETARRFAALGERVEFVALIDTILPLPDPGATQAELVLRRYERFAEHVERTYGVALDLPWQEMVELDEDEQMRRVMTALSSSDIGIGAGVLHHQYTSYVDARIAERYRPKPFDGRVLLYRAQEAETTTTTLDPRYLRTDEALGWDEIVPGLDVVRVPGNHLSMIDPPNVDVITAHLARVLDLEAPRLTREGA
ncbi:type I polyketide synthase [Saccharopolyspora gloriosae]|uniref:Phthiocerol/phenolphthiocerol synthesis type-I polyketide synthase D n=1 Tax=Saccharopolyspora gloriosae TaxID=455344 RepID=A0A840NGX5_9PSEU|nr:type I polyketide synthase [Saccharopolyspora gloriosae]MBB5071150.1 phthiocerol/phenolphthiocerol synthesis type-I polyketide synthase D [Saccharopolyspora gloriosae]